MGSKMDIRVVEIPDNVNFEIAEYDGIEYVREIARNWVHYEDDYWQKKLDDYITVGKSEIYK